LNLPIIKLYNYLLFSLTLYRYFADLITLGGDGAAFYHEDNGSFRGAGAVEYAFGNGEALMGKQLNGLVF
jgi:hypothetical protein